MTGSKSTAWSLRMAALPGVKDNLRDWCKVHGVVLAVKEFGDDESPNQEHYHLLLRTELLTDAAVRKWIDQLMGKTSRSDKSLKPLSEEADVENYLRYCCKGPNWHDVKLGKSSDRVPPIVEYTTLMPQTVSAYHAEFWTKNDTKREAIEKSKKLKQQDLVDACVEHIRPKGHTNWYDCVEDVTGYVTDHYKGKRNDAVLFPIIQSVMWHLDPGSVKKLVYQRMLQKFGPRVSMSMSETNLIPQA